MTKFWLLDQVPMPPSVNELYKKGRYGNIYKDSSKWDKTFERWRLDRESTLQEIAREVKWEMGGKSRKVIKIDVCYSIHPDGIWDNKGHFKRWDADNRIKALFDALSGVLGIDDRAFIPGMAAKTYDKSVIYPYCICRLSIKDILETDEFLQHWMQGAGLDDYSKTYED